MITIQLTRGYVTHIDDEDFERVSGFKWTAHFCRSKVYAKTNMSKFSDGKRTSRKTILLHRFLMQSEMEVDHRDGDGLNNIKDNLRLASHSQNVRNRIKAAGCSSRYKGVYLDRATKRWKAAITKDHKKYKLRSFKEEFDAALAYNLKAEEFFGEFANFNLPIGAT